MSVPKDKNFRIVAVLGTARPGNFTSKALALVIDEIEKQGDIGVDLIDPATMNLPLPGQGSDSAEPKTIQELVSKSTGVVFSTPEYHGSYSSAAKLIIENLGFPSVLAGKPVALVGVAAGQIGAIKELEHLRSVLSHVGAISSSQDRFLSPACKMCSTKKDDASTKPLKKDCEGSGRTWLNTFRATSVHGWHWRK